ncbi:hypothetical protein BGZ74_010668 [Mortierella antarctica]|nr:hypothetical protein BGZ74_010668 [Mortierella antarctica]
MSSADHKRKASSPEATTTTTESSTLGSSDHQPKKPRTEDTTTTTKNTIDHAPDCDDPSCPGCGEGELELQFDGKPSALELFSLAREEASKESLSTHGTGAAKKLFDLAIEAFEELEKSNAHLEMGDDPASEVAKTLLETKVQHAACVVAVGNYMPSLAMVQDGVAKYQKLFREHATMAGENSTALIGQGIAELSAVRLLRKEALKAAHGDEDEDEDEDDEEQEEALRAAAIVPRTESTLAKHAMDGFNKGLKILEATPGSSFAQESIRATQEMEEYGVMLFEQAFQHIEKARAAKPELFEQNADIQSLYGSCLFNKARMVTHEGNEQESKKLLDKAIEILTKAEEMQGEPGDAKTLETLGQAYMMSTVLTEDEDSIMDAYNAATDRLRRALELDPSNSALRKQLDAIEAESGDGDDYEDEDEFEEGAEEEEEEDDK